MKPSWLAPLLIAAGFFAAVAPTLTWLEFSNGSENHVVETVMEMRRGGPWLIPQQLGVPRLIKPPLTAWLSAAAVDESTVRAAASLDPDQREMALKKLAWRIRWPALLASCLLLAVIYELGRTLDGPRLGIYAAVAAGGTLLWLRFGRAATTDVQLALWVGLANLFFAKALLRGRRWSGWIVGGAAVGLAFMSKGPVALVQSVLPICLYVFITSRERERAGQAQLAGLPASPAPLPYGRGSSWAPPAIGLIFALAIILPWPLLVAWRYPDIWNGWWIEITRRGARDVESDPWYQYAALFAVALPWTLWLVAGSVLAWRQRRGPWLLPLLLLIVPIVVMSFFSDKPARYLLPMLTPLALLIGRGLLEHERDKGSRFDRIITSLHWELVTLIGLGLPLSGMRMLRTLDGRPWFTLPIVIAAIVMVLAILFSVRRRVVLATALIMLLTHGLFVYGYARSDGGLNDYKPLADAILARHGHAPVYVLDPRNSKPRRDLSIYLGQVARPAEEGAMPGPDAVLVKVESIKRPLPEPPPPWRTFHSYERGGKRYTAFEAAVRSSRNSSIAATKSAAD